MSATVLFACLVLVVGIIIVVTLLLRHRG